MFIKIERYNFKSEATENEKLIRIFDYIFVQINRSYSISQF